MESMEKARRYALRALAAMFVVGSFAVAGRVDYIEAVISEMSVEQYEYIRERLGGGATDGDVADEYMSRREFYDSLRCEMAARGAWE